MIAVETAPALPPRPTAQRASGLLLLGLVLVQVVWIFVVPPFRASDEFDHAYRAAAVARGQWVPSSARAPGVRGSLVTVPDDLVQAARAECARLSYTSRQDCRPVTRLG